MSEAREPTLPVRLLRTPMRDLIRFRLSCRLDWRRIINDAEIPDASKAMLTMLIRKTRLWRLEKAGVARELVAHFEDAVAAGQDEGDTLEKFGDWRKAAILIRRATKRKRGYMWHAWRYAFWSVVALIGLYTAMGLYYLTGSRNIAVDYTAVLNERAAAVPADDRAWPVMRDALLVMGYHQQASNLPQGESNVFQWIDEQARPGDEHWPAVWAYLNEHEASIAELRRASGMSGLGYIAGYVDAAEDLPLFKPDMTLEEHRREVELVEREHADEPPMVWAVTLPHLISLRTAARVLSIDAFRAAEAGDGQTAHDDLVAMLGIAEHANEQNVLINQLVMVSIRLMAFETLSDLMANYPALFSREQLADLAHRTAAVRVYTADFTGERHLMDDMIQHLYTDDGNGNGHLDSRAWQRMYAGLPSYSGLAVEPEQIPQAFRTVLTPGITMATADRKELKAMVDRLYALYEADYSVPMWQRPESQAKAELIDLLDGSLVKRARYNVIGALMPALGAVRMVSERYTASADGVLAGLALQLYYSEHGQYPDTLDALVPRYLPQLPVDRITGGPLRYTFKDGRPLLYSVGADRDDDGGMIVYDADGRRKREVIAWVTDEGQSAINGDWVVWPLHDEPASAR